MAMYTAHEGYFIITNSNLIFEVKGLVHPKDRFIAYLRYVPSRNGLRTGRDGVIYEKVYDLSERERYLKINHPEHLWFDEVNQRIQQSVHHDDIGFILDPFDYLNSLRERQSHLKDLEALALDLASLLADASEVEITSFGITGSLLAGLSTSTSDIDLIVRGSDNCRSVYNTLATKDILSTELERYEGQALSKHVEFRWGDLRNRFGYFDYIESQKVLQGFYRGRDFFIRLVKSPNEVQEYGEVRAKPMGRVSIEGVVTDDSQSIFTPCEYEIECMTEPKVKRLISFRGRFTEHVRKDMYILASGRLEEVIEGSAGRYFQLVLGEFPEDYLVPKVI